MSNAVILHILCEGPTEQGFADTVLKPYLMEQGITAVKSVSVMTNKKLSITGGLRSYTQVKQDLDILIHSHPDQGYERHLFTTMFDLYALPPDFPEYGTCKKIHDKYSQVESLEKAFGTAVGSERFIPYIQLHEFEALIFCGIDFLLDLYPRSDKQCHALKTILSNVRSPELINDKPETAPSKRIIREIEEKGNYSYNKPKTGKYVTEKVGIDNLRAKCPHFDKWIARILSAAGVFKLE